MKAKCIGIIFLSNLFFVNSLFAQGASLNLNPPVTVNRADNSFYISSDFGPREACSTCTKFHAGIDYSANSGSGDPDEGTEIIARESGTIDEIKYGSAGIVLAYKSSDNQRRWNYFHLFPDISGYNKISNTDSIPYFPNRSSTNWEYIVVTSPPPEYNAPTGNFLVHWENRDTYQAEVIRGTDESVIDSDERAYLRFVVQRNDEWHFVFTAGSGEFYQIATDDIYESHPIGPLGKTGTDNFHCHLGLGTYPYYANPLYHVIHQTADYTFTLHEPQQDETVFHLPDASCNSDACSERVKIYVGTIGNLDLDKVEVFINQNGESVMDTDHRIKSEGVESRFEYGGIPPDSQDRYPASISNLSDGSTNGVDPEPGAGKDTFYYVSFNSKINETRNGTAQCLADALYPDGRYNLRFRAVSIRNVNHDATDVRNIIIDNFWPFVERVNINAGCQVYTGRWVCNGGSIALQQENPHAANGASGMSIEVQTSEPMANVSINGFTSATAPFIPFNGANSPAPADGMTWRFTLSSEAIRQMGNGVYQISISGADHAGHPLMGLTSDSSPVALPQRQDQATWLPTPLEGPDLTHRFEIRLPEQQGGQRVAQCEAVPDSATDCNDNCVPDECDIADNPANNDNVIYVL